VNVSRLVAQKGIDLIIDIIPLIRNFNMQILILGSGDSAMEKQLVTLANDNPDQVAVKLGYDEKLAHQLTAGGDYFLMPSRFEPCGLNQMYSQRYGTLPVVTAVGGLKDTVVDINNQENSAPTGIKMNSTTSKDLLHAIICALNLYADAEKYKQIQANAMRANFSWQKSATDYLNIYSKSIN
jgi:starch synthase